VCVLTRVPLGTTGVGRSTNPTESDVGNWATRGFCPSQITCCGKLLPFTVLVTRHVEMFSAACEDAKRCSQMLWQGYVSNPAFKPGLLVSDDASLQFPHAFLVTTIKCSGEVLASPCPHMHSATLPFNELQLRGSQKDVQVPGSDLSSVRVSMPS